MSVIRGRFRADEGMTLVELMVALLILGVVLAAMASTLITSLLSVQRAEAATQARQIGQQELEKLQALDWEDAGFYASEVATASHLGGTTFGGEELAILPPQSPRPTQIPEPEDLVSVDGVDFAVRRAITWRNTGDGDHKHFTVFVDYGRPGNVQTIEMRALRAPEPNEAVRTFAVDTFTATPDEVTRDTSGSFTPGTIDVTVATSSSADNFVTLTWEHEDGTTGGPITMVSTDGGFTWNTTLAPTTLGWTEGIVSLNIYATRGALTAEDTRTISVLTAGAPPVISVRGLEVTQEGLTDVICVSGGGKPSPNAVVRADIRGLGSTDVNRVKVDWTGSQAAAPIQMSYDQNTTDGLGAWFKLTVDNNFKFTVDPADFTVYIDDVPAHSTPFSSPVYTKGGGGSDPDDCD